MWRLHEKLCDLTRGGEFAEDSTDDIILVLVSLLVQHVVTPKDRKEMVERQAQRIQRAKEEKHG